MNVLVIITARGGSKGVKSKNILPLNGIPLIAYTFDFALKAKLPNKIVLSTESKKIKEVALRCGIKVIDRPKELAKNTSLIEDSIIHALNYLKEKEDYLPDYIVSLYGNIPIRKEGLIDKALRYLIKSGADTVISVIPVGKYHPEWMLKLDKDLEIYQNLPCNINQRQRLSKLYIHDGAICVRRREVLLRKNGRLPLYRRMGNKVKALILKPEDTVDVDNYADLLYAEYLVKKRNIIPTCYKP
jgi:CMP-N-acetylneuraminic acid synthetase